MRYVTRRILFYLVAIFASLTINFFIPRLMPGDPASAMMARFQGQMGPEALTALREAFGFTQEPLLTQYVKYLTHVVQGDFGISISYFPSPVTQVIGLGFLWTILLAGTAVIISFALGSFLGVIGAWKRGGFIDSVLPPALTFIGSFPYFFLAMTALFFLSFRLGLFPLRHAYSDSLTPTLSLPFLLDVLWHMTLPALCIILVSMGGWMLTMRSTMITTLAEDYVTLADAKGLPQRRIMFNYAARNAMLPNITAFGMALGFVLSGQLLTEIVFAYPGLGYMLLQAVRMQDYPLMQGLFLMITFAVLGANLIVDLLYIRMDPRVRRA
ncbi:Dipeptide transport system permease protein DppB [Thermoflexales bacterium]|nr:Dipeptide transport system permease protein DppB [Thermoflexales bacterium]